MGGKVEMSFAAMNEVALGGWGPGPECLICVLSPIVEGNVGRKVGRLRNLQEHMRAASLIGEIDVKVFSPLFSYSKLLRFDIVPNWYGF